MIKHIYCILFVFLITTGCKHQHNHEHDHDHESGECQHDHEHEDAEEEEINDENAIHFSKAQSEKIEFATEVVTKQPFGQVIKTTAQVVSAAIDETIIPAKSSGIVTFPNNQIAEGKSVNPGQSLFSISGSGINDNVNIKYAEARSNYEIAKSTYERNVDLAKDKIVAEKELLRSKNEYENAQTVYDNFRKNFSSQGQNVASPSKGFIKQLLVANGQYVEAGQALLVISKNEKLTLKGEVQQKYAPLLSNIVSANIHLVERNLTYSLEDLNGKMLSFGRSVNPDSYLIPVNFEIDNKAGFIPGGFVELFIKIQTQTSSISVPNAALTEEQGSYFVFVQIAPELYDKREVKTGGTDGLRTEILQGLKENETIVSKGANILKLSVATGALDPHAGHAH